jgi:hypothetical protein
MEMTGGDRVVKMMEPGAPGQVGEQASVDLTGGPSNSASSGPQMHLACRPGITY